MKTIIKQFSLAALLLTAFASPVLAEEPQLPTVFKVEKILELQQVVLSDLQYDGFRAFFTVAQDDRYWNTELWGVEVRSESVVLQEPHAGRPRLSPGGALAYEKYGYLLDDKEEKVYRANLTVVATDLEQQASPPEKEGTFRLLDWSPDEKELYLQKVELDGYSPEQGGPRFQEKGTYAWNAQSGELTLKEGKLFDPNLSPDGRRRMEIVTGADKKSLRIMAVHREGSKTKIADSLIKESHSEFPWSPQILWLDNDRVLVAVYGGKPEPRIGLLLFDFSKKKGQPVLEKESLHDYPLVTASRDGQKFLFRSSRTMEQGDERLSVLDLQKGNSFSIWENHPDEGEWQDAAWAPNGKSLVLLIQKENQAVQPTPFSRPPAESRLLKITLPEPRP